MFKTALFDCAINEKRCSVDGGRGTHPTPGNLPSKAEEKKLMPGGQPGGGGADGIDRCIIIPLRKYEAVIHCSVLWFTTGQLPADAKGETVAELDEAVDGNKIENRRQNIYIFFCGGIINLLFDGLAYNNILLIDRNLFYATRKISARIIC